MTRENPTPPPSPDASLDLSVGTKEKETIDDEGRKIRELESRLIIQEQLLKRLLLIVSDAWEGDSTADADQARALIALREVFRSIRGRDYHETNAEYEQYKDEIRIRALAALLLELK